MTQTKLTDSDEKEPESRLDTGASEQFADDRKSTENEQKSGEQYKILAEDDPGKGFATTKEQTGLDEV